MSDQYDRELVKRIKEGDLVASKELEKHYFEIIKRICYGNMDRGLALSELLLYGKEGLFVAVREFDETRGFTFSSNVEKKIRNTIDEKIEEVKHE